MKRLLLMRHGKSDWDDESLNDFDRPLNNRGLRASKAVGEWIAQNGLEPATVLVSAAVRTTQTWEILGTCLKGQRTVQVMQELYLASPGTLLAHIERIEPDCESALVIAHNPGMESLCRLMAGPGSAQKDLAELQLGFPTAGLAVIELNGETWRTMSAEGGKLTAFLRPRTLERD